MENQEPYVVIRKLTRVSDGAIGMTLDGKLHSWEGQISLTGC